MINLKKFLADNIDRLDNLEKYSILNCLSEDEIINLYFEYGLEDIIVRYIEKYNHEQKREYTKIILDLLNVYEKNLPSERRTLRESLVTLVSTLKFEIQVRIFNLLADSDDVIENRRASQISKLIWNDEVQQKIIDIYRKNQDKFIAVQLIDNLNEEDILRYFQELWKDSLRNFEKQKLIDKANNKGNLPEEYLKKVGLKFYLLTLVKQRIRLDEVSKLYIELEYGERTYIKWIAGKMKCQSLLLELIELDRYSKEES